MRRSRCFYIVNIFAYWLHLLFTSYVALSYIVVSLLRKYLSEYIPQLPDMMLKSLKLGAVVSKKDNCST